MPVSWLRFEFEILSLDISFLKTIIVVVLRLNKAGNQTIKSNGLQFWIIIDYCRVFKS